MNNETRGSSFASQQDLNALKQRLAADGFVVMPQLVTGKELAEILANVDRFINEIVPQLPAEQVFYESKSDHASLKQIQHMENHDSWFRELFVSSRICEIAASMLGTPAVAKNMQYFNKPPGVGKPTPPHQDGYYFMLDPCEAVTMWLALDDVDEGNGCVRYVRGSHRRGMRDHARTQTLGFSQGIVDFPTGEDRRNETAVPARRGDLLVHDALTIHRADGNRSADRPRRAIGFVYFSQRAREDTDAQAAYQRRLAEELKTAGKI